MVDGSLAIFSNYLLLRLSRPLMLVLVDCISAIPPRGGGSLAIFFQLFTPQVKSSFDARTRRLYISAIPPRGGGSLAIFLEEVVAELPKLMRTAAGALGLDSWSGFTCELYISATPPRGGGRGRGGRISCHFFQLFTPQVKSSFDARTRRLYISAIPPRGGGSLAIFLEEVVAELPKLMRTAAGRGRGGRISCHFFQLFTPQVKSSFDARTRRLYISAIPPRGGGRGRGGKNSCHFSLGLEEEECFELFSGCSCLVLSLLY